MAVQTNEIADRQAELTERQLQPIISAEHHYRFQGDRADTEYLTVTNLGPAAQGINVDVIALMVVTHATRAATSRRVLVVKHYYPSMGYSGNPTGLLVTINGTEGNNGQMTRLDRACSQYGEQRRGILLFDLRTFLRVSYTDQLGKRHTLFLEVSPVGGASAVDDERGQAIFELYDDRPFDALAAKPQDVISATNASKLTPEQLGLS